jgi:ferredoxin
MAKILVDRDICYGAGECVKVAPQAFELDDEGFVSLLDPDSVGAELLRQAVQKCPSGALSLEDDEDE